MSYHRSQIAGELVIQRAQQAAALDAINRADPFGFAVSSLDEAFGQISFSAGRDSEGNIRDLWQDDSTVAYSQDDEELPVFEALAPFVSHGQLLFESDDDGFSAFRYRFVDGVCRREEAKVGLSWPGDERS